MSVAGGKDEEEEAESLQFVTIPVIYFLLQFVAIPLIYFLLLLSSYLRTLFHFHLSGKASTQTHSGRVYFWSFLPAFYTSEALHTHGQDRERQTEGWKKEPHVPLPSTLPVAPFFLP